MLASPLRQPGNPQARTGSKLAAAFGVGQAATKLDIIAERVVLSGL